MMQELCQRGSLDAFLDELTYQAPLDFSRTKPAVKRLFKWAVQGDNIPVALWLFDQHTKSAGGCLLSGTLLKHANSSETRTTLYRAMIRVAIEKLRGQAEPVLNETLIRVFDVETVIRHDRFDCIDVLLSECGSRIRSLCAALRKRFTVRNYGRGYLQLMSGYGKHGVFPAEYLLEKAYDYTETQKCMLACLGVLPFPYRPVRIMDWDSPETLVVLLRYTERNVEFRRNSRSSLLHWFRAFCFGMETHHFNRDIPEVDIRLACLAVMWRFRWQEIPLLRFIAAFESHQEQRREWRAAGHGDDDDDGTDDDVVSAAIHIWMLSTLDAAKRRLCTLLMPVARHFLAKPATGTLYRRAALSFHSRQVEEFRKRRLCRLVARAWRWWKHNAEDFSSPAKRRKRSTV